MMVRSEDDYFDDDLLAFLSVLTCMSFDFENVFINWLLITKLIATRTFKLNCIHN